MLVGSTILVTLGVLPLGAATSAAPPAPPGAATATAAAADGCAAPTVVGTDGDDVLVGTAGADVISAGSGDDVVHARGGNDTVCGGNGEDRLLGGSGDDVVGGGNGGDLVVGEDGDDVLSGGNGDDVVYGTGGDDRTAGDLGDDLLGGGSGDDDQRGGSGDDDVRGGRGADGAAGDRGDDTCEAEDATACEHTPAAGPSDVTAALAVAPGVQVRPFDVELSATADRGVALLVLEADGATWRHVRVTGEPTSVSRTVTLDPADLPVPGTALTVVAVDRDGNEVRSERTAVPIRRDLGLEGASTGVSLAGPTPLSRLAPVLLAVDAPIMEFRHVRDLARSRPVPGTVAASAAADGIEVLPAGRHLVGGFYGRGMTTADQLATYAGLSEDGDPMVTSIRFEGELDARQRALLAPYASEFRSLPAREGYETGPAAAEGSATPAPARLAATDPATAGADKPTDLDAAYPDGLDAGSRAARAPMTASARPTDVDNGVFWPSFGQLDTTEHDVHIDRPIIWDTTEKRVTFDHDLVFAPGVPENFADLDRAYEHDFKIDTDRLTVGIRPACDFVNPFVGNDDAFYAYRDGVIWETNVPDDADPYFDTDLSDGCGKEDLSVGIRKPEELDQGLLDGQSRDYWFGVDAARGTEHGDFTLQSQQLTRLNDAGCWVIGDQNCTGLDTGEGSSGFILRTQGELIPGVTLPTCFSWHWAPDPDQRSNEQASLCSRDADGDGWDDSVDCAPDDASINPGEVDVPNDGIDQNCDGSDLVVGSGTLQFTLIWDNANDQDLHVIEPDGTRIWYAATGPTGSGGRLDRDDNVGMCGGDPEPGGVENIYWPADTPAPIGDYFVEVRQYSSCGTPANWTLEIRDAGQLVQRITGVGSGTVTYSR